MDEIKIQEIVQRVYREVTQSSLTHPLKNKSAIEKGLVSSANISKYTLARMIDHTLLNPEATREQILQLCKDGTVYHFFSVCVNPCWVKTCYEILSGSDVNVCTVVGFPLGSNTTCLKVEETKRAVLDGAHEIDMVINVGKLKSGEIRSVFEDIQRVVAAAGQGTVKVIIEACLLTAEEKVVACFLAQKAGAGFVKTSTGFNKSGATDEDIRLMRQVVGIEMGVKAAGEIRDLQSTLTMIDAGANRIGTSSGIAIINTI